MPHWRSLIEKDHLGAWDLCDPVTDKPRDYTVTIVKVETSVLKTVGDSKGKRKAVLSFHKAKKKMVANATNCKILESMYGPDYSKWVGQKITLYYAMTRNPQGSGQVPCIRIRPRRPEGAAEAIPDREVDQDVRDQQNEAFNPDTDQREHMPVNPTTEPNPDEDGR